MTKYARRRKSKKSYLIAILLLAAVIVLALFLILDHKNQEKPQPTEAPDNSTVVSTQPEPSDSSSAAEKDNENISSEPTPEQAPVENPKQTTQNEGVNPNTLAEITGVITRANVTNDKLLIRVNIDQYLTSGSCSLTLTSGDNKYTDAANIIAEASTSTCAGFDIPTSELGSGNWNITIQISSGDKKGIINGEVSL